MESNKTNINEKKKKERKSPRNKNGFLIIDRQLHKAHSGVGSGDDDDDGDDANNNKEQCDGLCWFFLSYFGARARVCVCVHYEHIDSVERSSKKSREGGSRRRLPTLLTIAQSQVKVFALGRLYPSLVRSFVRLVTFFFSFFFPLPPPPLPPRLLGGVR